MRRLSLALFLMGLGLVVSSTPIKGSDDFKPEPGFVSFFNGKNLDGWKTKKGNEPLDGQTEAYKGRFKVAEGKLIIDPKVKGDVVITSVKEWAKDVHIKLEFLPGQGCNNDLFFRGNKFDLTKGNVKNLKPDDWNELEIIAKGGVVEFKNNGETQRKATANKGGTNSLGIRAEFGHIQLRRLRAKETP